MKRLILFAILTLTFVFPANEPKCDPAAVIKQAAALTSTGDTTKDMAALLKLQNDISAANIACNGMTFSGIGSKVVDPFVLSKGTFKVILDSALQSGVIEIDGISPDHCAGGTLSGKHKETLVKVYDDDCKIAIEVNTFGDTVSWAITFEPL